MTKTKEKKHNNRIRNILMERDGITAEEADELIQECRQSLNEGNYCAINEYLGLEDDYIFDLI